MNHFETFQIQPMSLRLDAKELERRFYSLSRESHPDLKGGDLEAVDASAKLNGAYRILRDPWQRASYVLTLFQIPLGSKIPPCLAPVYFELQESEDRKALSDLKNQLVNGKVLRDHQLDETFGAFDRLRLTQIELPASQKVLDVLSLIRELVLENNYANSMLRDLEQKLEGQKNVS